MLDSILKIDDNLYLPISDMSIVYNITVKYIKETNRVVIDELDKGMIKATAVTDTKIKFKPRGLSKNIGYLKKGEIVSCYYTTSKGWRQIRKDDGIVGYIKANKLGREYIVRQDMNNLVEAKTIDKEIYNSNSFKIYDGEIEKYVVLKDLFSITENGINVKEKNDNENELIKIWVSIINSKIGNRINQIISDYKLRTELIDLIVDKSVENNVNGVCINFSEVENNENIKRFLIELSPKLREIGINICLVINDNIEKDDYLNIVDYIVE